MAKAIATREEVFKKADEMLMAGVKLQDLTIISLQEAVGGGSYTTVKKWLDEFREERKSQQIEQVQLPEAVVKKLMELGGQIMGLLSEDFRQQIETIRSAASEETLDARTQCQQAEAAIQKLEATVEEQEQLIASHVATMNTLQESVIESKRAEERALARTGELEGRVQDLKIDVERERESSNGLRERLAELEVVNERLREQLAVSNERASSESARALELDRRVVELEGRVQDLKVDLERERGSSNGLRERLAEMEQVNDRLRDQLAVANERAGSESARALELDRRVVELNAKLDASHEDYLGAHRQADEAIARGNAESIKVAALEARGSELSATIERMERLLADQRVAAEVEAKRTAEKVESLEGEREAARQELGLALQQKARLEGEIEAMKVADVKQDDSSSPAP
ncbi:DNA-binding protein [Chromobacterium haemolyticum]|uniref:DNA-binding protein n=1 Tax=Chromobacterium haemolyticum TaxID=394935 RepID=UPI0024484980|nr:DNA-binding protein [Chromobacterium haemolyticum]MDH0341989.1 DNA-binding protein [Chromobacterium haemolyticum]